jgi:amino acid transporter
MDTSFFKRLFKKQNGPFWLLIVATVWSILSYLLGEQKFTDFDGIAVTDEFGLYGAIALIVTSLFFIFSNAKKIDNKHQDSDQKRNSQEK